MIKKFKITFNSPAVLTFVLISLFALILNGLTKEASNKLLFMTYHSSLLSPLTYIRFITHVFGHADWSHFIGNMSYLLLLGPMLEEKHGTDKIIKIILVTAIVTGVMNYVLFPDTALCGASGVVFAFMLLTSFTSFKEGELPVTFIFVAVIFIGQQIYDGITVTDNISNLSHITGGVIGSALGYNLNRKKA